MYQISKKKIYITMAILFAAAMGFVMLIDYVQLNNQIMNYEKEQTVHAEKAAISSLRSIDKASSLLEQETSKKMEEASLLIQEKYEENPHFKTWDFEKLKRTFGMDIYIIDKDSTIVYSSEREEIGMNFAECCGTLNEILEERRETGQLYIDDIDIQKNTGQMKKFSYMATNDKKYMIELGYSLEDEAVFEEFNFINTMEDIENTYPSVKKMNVFSFGAIPFDQTEEEIEKERKRAVRQTRDTYEITEMDGMFNQEPVIYRYIPYIPSQGNKEQVKVIEMVYSETSAFSLFTEHKFMFVVKLLLIMGISLMLPYVLIKIYSRSYRSLFYNDTTKRKNRVAFDHDLKEKLSKEEAFSLLLFQVKDVDINDIQHLLQFFEEKLSEFKMNETIYDLGAGEFGCIVTDNENTDLDLMTKLFIEKMDEVKESNVSASIHIGTASANQNDTVKILYKKADTALDQAKQINNSNVQYDKNHPQISNHG